MVRGTIYWHRRLRISSVLPTLYSLFLPVPLILLSSSPMALPGPYSGVSTLAFVARASVFTYGVVYGSIKLSYLKTKAKSHKTQAKGHH